MRPAAVAKASLNRAKVACYRPEAIRSTHVQVEGRVKPVGGPNRSLLKKARMRCG